VRCPRPNNTRPVSRVRAGSTARLATAPRRSGYFGRATAASSPNPLAAERHAPRLMTDNDNDQSSDRSTFQGNLIRVMAVQVGALVVLWLIQSRYTV
jgi:hypothetical protein